MNIAITEPERESAYADSQGMDAPSRCIAIIWARKLASKNDRIVLAQAVRGINGVTHVSYGDRKPLILIVAYQPDKTSALDIASALRATEGNVRLVGC